VLDGIDAGARAITSEERERLVCLSPWQFVLVRALARRLCAADEAGAPSADEVGVAEFVDVYVARAPEHVRDELMGFFAFLEHGAPLAIGKVRGFSSLSASAQDQVLNALATSRLTLLRGGFAGIKSLVMMGYYKDPRAFAITGYQGPRVGPRGEGAV